MWKISKITFENFARIKSGVGRNTLTLNLDKFNNAVTLFVGGNGTGKSAILRSLHPFAYNSNSGDTNSNAELICAGCNGKKIIDITFKDCVYHIEHHYLRQKKDNSLSVKSYISLNGHELNDSGTVTTFKQIVKNHLGLDETFLTMLSLGDSIKGFVEYKSSDRKKYASKIFSELHVYDDYYKTITNEVRSLKSIMSNISFKLNKYSGIDIDDLNSAIIQLSSKIDHLKDTLRTTNIQIGQIRANIDNNSEFIQNYEEIRDRYLANIDIRKNTRSLISSQYASENVNSIKSKLSDVFNHITDLERRINESTTLVKSNLDQIDMTKMNLTQVETTLSGISSNDTIDDLLSLKENIQSNIDKISYIISSDNIPNIERFTPDELISLQTILTQLSTKCYDLLLINPDKQFIINLYSEYLKDRSVVSKFNDNYNSIANSIENYNMFYQTKLVLDRKIHYDCKDKNCPYKQFYTDYINMVATSMSNNQRELDIKYEKLNKLKSNIQLLNIFDDIVDCLKTNDITEDRIPRSIFDIQKCIERGLTDPDGFMHNDKELIRYIDMLENMKELSTLITRLAEVNTNIEYLSSNITIKNNLNSLVSQYNNTITDLSSRNNDITSSIDKLKSELNSLYSERDDIVNTIDNFHKINELTISIDNDKSTLDSMHNKKDEIDKLKTKLQSLYELSTSIANEIKSHEADKDIKTNVLIDIRSLLKEEESIRQDYDVAIDIQEAVSPIKGIPTEFIENYIRGKIIPSINELLYSIYGNRLQILADKVIVNSDQFTIPYRTRNDIVNDISNASDGERAMISLAFSLTLTKLLMIADNDEIHYNIMLLDEMDRALDITGRSRYIELIEYYISTIKANQIFISSHNNMFDNYPVNVIRTSDGKMPNVDTNDLIDLS